MSELVRVKIKGMVITAQYGTLTSGQILRTSREFAQHLVEQCNAAEYMDVDDPDAEAKAKAKAEAEEKAKADAELKAKQEAEAKAKAEAEKVKNAQAK